MKLPHEILNAVGKSVYYCRPCGATSNLHWFRGTSCPVCSSPECKDQLEKEFRQAYDDLSDCSEVHP